MMSSPFTQIYGFAIPNILHLAGILLLTLIALRLLRSATDKLVKPAGPQKGPQQQREQNTRALADGIYAAASKVIWIVAALTALPEFGISAWPGLVIAGASILGFSIGAGETIRDTVAGFQIVKEDQFVVGDTIQAGETVGRVEQLTLRRTVVRDVRGALVSISNGQLRTVSNLSRDWAQSFVDVGLTANAPLETLQALEQAAAGLRGDPAWAPALVDGPRVLGVQELSPAGTTIRLQVRTAPTRQDEVCRELRRRVQMELQRQGIAMTTGGASKEVGTPLT